MCSHQRVVVVVLLVDPDGLVVEPELEPAGPPIELVLPLVPLPEAPELPLVVVSVLLPPLVLPLPLAVLPDPDEPEPEPLVDGVVLEELVEPLDPVEPVELGVEPVEPLEPVAPVPVAPSRLSQALSVRAATTARVAAAH